MKRSHAVAVLSFAGGLLFGAGACISGMVRPSKILGFLDLAGSWDASLALVMGTALIIHAIAWRIIRRTPAPRFGDRFPPPPSPAIDRRLLGGAALFGVGWGLSGYCPGPAVVSLVSGAPTTFVFVGAMLGGMLLVHVVDRSGRSDG